ncbi:MAG: insulinase family protein, partial [Candidatus Eisenbacteria bacterium]|nr:insulinase family protein [Candidatus Eisenbacteria bacterium]
MPLLLAGLLRVPRSVPGGDRGGCLSGSDRPPEREREDRRPSDSGRGAIVKAATGFDDLGDRTRTRLDNGLVVLVLGRRHLPIVSATLLSPAGIAHQPSGLGGLANFASQLLPLGTGRRSATELAEEIDGLGASLSSGCDYDFATVEVAGLARDLGRLIEILADVARRPAFLEEEIERKRSQLLGLLEKREDEYPGLVRDRFFEMVYGGHPYHRRREGNAESVKSIARSDLVGFHEGAYTPEDSILAIVGDVDLPGAIRLAEEGFGGWRASRTAAGLAEVQPAPAERRVATIQKEVTQAYIRIGSLGIARDDPDFHAAAITNFVLGGAGFGSRLMRNLREDRGLTYGVYTSFQPRRRRGYFFAAMQTKVETMNEAVREILRECELLSGHGVTEEELAWAKRFFTGSLPLQLETNDQLAQKLLEQEFFGLEDRFWLRDLEKMGDV